MAKRKKKKTETVVTPPQERPEAPPEEEDVMPVDVPPKPCDTCKRAGGIIKACPDCGKTYCNLCRTPYKGSYQQCQFCQRIF